MQRRLAGILIIDGVDDEWWPQEDERAHAEVPVQMILDTGQPASYIEIPHLKWGGECRVEVSLTAQVIGTGQIQVKGEAKLFEGSSEDTTDLEDSKIVGFVVPKSGIPAHHNIALLSTGAGGGDSADIKISFTNSMIEDG